MLKFETIEKAFNELVNTMTESSDNMKHVDFYDDGTIVIENNDPRVHDQIFRFRICIKNDDTIIVSDAFKDRFEYKLVNGELYKLQTIDDCMWYINTYLGENGTAQTVYRNFINKIDRRCKFYKPEKK